MPPEIPFHDSELVPRVPEVPRESVTRTRVELQELAMDLGEGERDSEWSAASHVREADYFVQYMGEDPSDPSYKEKHVVGLKDANGRVVARVYRDAGVTFYQVKAGDTLYGIRRVLASVPEFSYLKDLPDYGVNSFNVRNPRVKLWPGMFIPVPLAEGRSELTEEFFARDAVVAVEEMLAMSDYAPYLKEIFHRGVTVPELVSMMIAVAKQESGGVPIGQMAPHRYEPAQGVFSYSICHVLMNETGVRARRTLRLSEGQLYHPRNAAKILLAFMIEKSLERLGPNLTPDGRVQRVADALTGFLPFGEEVGRFETFAGFYNGGAWRAINPDYAEEIHYYYEKALAWMEGRFPFPSEESVETFVEVGPLKTVGRRSFKSAVEEVNFRRPPRLIRSDTALQKVLVQLEGDFGVPLPDDRIGIGRDSMGRVFVVYERDDAESVFYDDGAVVVGREE